MPNNAVLSIVGDVSFEDGFTRLRPTWSRSSPVTRRSGRSRPALPPLTEPRVIDHHEDVPSPGVWFAGRLPVDAPDSRELAAVSLASAVLGESETSRLYRRVVRQDRTALTAGLGLNTLIAGNSLGLGSVRALPGQDLDAIVSAVETSCTPSRSTDRPNWSSRWRGPRRNATGSTRWAPPPDGPTRSRPARCCSTTRSRSTNDFRCCAASPRRRSAIRGAVPGGLAQAATRWSA